METPISNSDFGLRRSSTRSIKRRKFDDELVESSLKSDRSKSKIESKYSSGSVQSAAYQFPSRASFNNQSTQSFPRMDNQLSTSSILSPGSDMIAIDSPNESDSNVYSKAELSSSKSAKTGIQTSSTGKLSTWRAEDDLSLIMAVQRTCNLDAVHLSIKFSKSFTLAEVKERWFNLLYNPNVSRPAMNAIRQLPSDVSHRIERESPFFADEEKLLKTIPANSNPDLGTFEALLEENPGVFIPVRTSRCLFNHWSRMREYDLLPFSEADDARQEKLPNFFEVLDKLNDSDLLNHKGSDVEKELQLVQKQEKKEIEELEKELKTWKVMVRKVVGVTSLDFDGNTYAILKGRLVQFLMKSEEAGCSTMTLGRSTTDSKVDADLSMEGPAHKISRKHFTIRLEPRTIDTSLNVSSDAGSCGQKNHIFVGKFNFSLLNHAKRPVFVDGSPVLRGDRAVLRENSLIEVSCLKFAFFINDSFSRSLDRDINSAP